MRGALLCVVLAAASVPARVGAQSVTLTESEALERLAPDSPRVRAVRAGVELARADVLAAGRWPNPRLTVDRESVAGATEYLTMVSQPLPTSGRRQFEMQSATANVAATMARADDEVRRLRADLRLAFADLLTAQIHEAELTRVRDRLQELTTVLARREAAGDAAGYDRLRVDRERLDAEADLVVATADRRRAQAMLASFFSGADTSQFVAAASAGPRSSLPPLESLVERAEATRGDLRALRHDVEAATLAGRAAGRRLRPEPEIVAGTKSSTFGTGDIGNVLMVHATVPLFDRAKPERALAQARASQATAREDALRMALRGHIEALRVVVEGYREAADRYRSAALSTSDHVERIARVSYDAGERGILELLDAHRTSAAARVRQAALDLAVRRAEIELEFATGWEFPR